jgi:hypothetical protein
VRIVSKLFLSFFILAQPGILLGQSNSQPQDHILNWKSFFPRQAAWEASKASIAIEIATLNIESANELLEMNLSCLHKNQYSVDGSYVGNADCDVGISRFTIKRCSSSASDLSDLCLLLVGFRSLDYLEQGRPLDSPSVRASRVQMSMTAREFQEFIEDRLRAYFKSHP